MKATPEQIEALKVAAEKAGTGRGNLEAVIRNVLGFAGKTDPFTRLTSDQAQRLTDAFDAKRLVGAAEDAVEAAEQAQDALSGLLSPENPHLRYLGAHAGSDGDVWHRAALAEGTKLSVSIRKRRV